MFDLLELQMIICKTQMIISSICILVLQYLFELLLIICLFVMALGLCDMTIYIDIYMGQKQQKQ